MALDVGSSTGGFTDVLLSRGAAKVYAVDVGTNQLAWKLRQDPRVVVHEQTNARTLDASIIPEPVDIVVCDASFIGLAKVLEAPLKLAKPGAKLVALIKPQFEAGREEVGKGGVVRDPAVHERVCAEAKGWVESQGWTVLGDRAEPDHRARRQCRIPAGSGEEWLKHAKRGAGGSSRWSPCSRSMLLGAAERLAVEQRLRQRRGSTRCTSRSSCRPAGCSASSGRSSTRCSASRWR